jgi:hypothetical protein
MYLDLPTIFMTRFLSDGHVKVFFFLLGLLFFVDLSDIDSKL